MIKIAERRMFAKTIIDSDLFLDMPSSTQCLYFHLSMRADDDGFINNPKKIQRMVGSGDDDLKLLIAKNFIIPFESGVVVIKHWKIHNYIQKDRYKETLYKDEKLQLSTGKNKEYILGIPNDNNMDTKCIHDVSNSETQVRLGKVRLGKVRLGKYSLPTEEKDVSKSVDNSKSEKLSSMSKLYQENIGMINGIVAEWITEISEKIDVELFKEALVICTDKGKLYFNFLKGIINNWLQKNITSYEELKAFELQNKFSTNSSVSKNNNNIQNSYKKGAGANVNETFRNYDPSIINELAMREQQEKINKLKNK